MFRINLILCMSSLSLLVVPQTARANDYQDYYHQMMASLGSSAPEVPDADEAFSGAHGEPVGATVDLADPGTYFDQQMQAAEGDSRPAEPTPTHQPSGGEDEIAPGYPAHYYQQMMASRSCRVPADSAPAINGSGVLDDPQVTTSISDGIRRTEELYMGQNPPVAGLTVVGRHPAIVHEQLTVLTTDHSRYDTQRCGWVPMAASSVQTWDVRYEGHDPDGYGGSAKAVQYTYKADADKGWEEVYTHQTGRLEGPTTLEWDLRIVDGIKQGTIKEVTPRVGGGVTITIRRYQRSSEGDQEEILWSSDNF